MKKRVCITIPNLHGAGCERMLSELLPYYAQQYEVDLVLQEQKVRYVIPDSIRPVVLGVEPGPKHTLSTVLKLRKLFTAQRYDAIVSYLDTYNFAVWLATLGLAQKPVHIACEHTTDREFFLYSRMSPWKIEVFKKMLRTVYSRVDRVVAVSQNLKNFLVRDLGISTPIDVIHNAVDPAKFNLEPPDLAGIDAAYTAAGSRVLSIARLDFQKNIPFLLDAFALVSMQVPDAHLFILGDGPLAGEMETQVQKLELSQRVSLLGFRPNPEDYLKLAEVFVATSRYESFGNVVVEALACGVPIVTTNYGEVVNEIITSDGLGKIVKQGDLHAFSESVISAVRHPQFNSREKISQYAIDSFGIERKAANYLDVVEEALARSPKRHT